MCKESDLGRLDSYLKCSIAEVIFGKHVLLLDRPVQTSKRVKILILASAE